MYNQYLQTYRDLELQYERFCRLELHLNMERGWPCKEQLELSLPMLDMVTSHTLLEKEVDYRGYAGTGGIEPAKKLFSQMLQTTEDQIYIGGTMSTTIMYDIIEKLMRMGIGDRRTWNQYSSIKFICPAPGYEKHFKICDAFGIDMIPVDMTSDGPDMDQIEDLVLKDEAIKGIWCVPLYSNPTGSIYSDQTVMRLASMPTKASDFRIFWDHAYCVHHLTNVKYKVLNILEECQRFNHADRAFMFASTSKITFPGGGVALCASSEKNIKWLEKNSILQLKTGDKINQLRHVLFLKDMNGIDKHMEKHREIIEPKFDLVNQILTQELEHWSVAKWEKPKGGYFFNLQLRSNMASAVWKKCREAGVYFTPAGSTFPNEIDLNDCYLRLAPTYPSVEELQIAIKLLCCVIKMIHIEQLLKGKDINGENC